MKSKRTLMYGAITVTLASALALGGLELAVRILAPQHTKVSVPAVLDHELIYRLPSYAEGTDVKEEFAVTIRTNALGLRDRDYAATKRQHVLRRLLVLGDSMTFAEGVETEETYPKFLEQALGDRYEVINAAIRGYGTDQELVLFEMLIPAYRPDVVVLAVYPSNDFDDNLYGHLFEIRDDTLVRVPLSKESSPKLRYYNRQSFIQNFPGYRFLIQHSHLMNLLRTRWAAFEFQRAFPDPTLSDTEEEKAWELTRALLLAWEDRARRASIEPVLLIIPSSDQVYTGKEPSTDARTERLLAHARTQGLPLVDAREVLQAAREMKRLYYQKDRHMTPEGHRVVAKFLRTELVSLGILP